MAWRCVPLRRHPAEAQRGPGSRGQRSRADRVARGKDARAAAPLGVACGVPAGRVAGSGGAAAGAVEVAGAGAGADPAWPDAGVAVHVLPGGGAADGGGSGHHARLGAVGAVVRGCAPVQLRRVRLAGAATWSSTSTTSTRPCPGRSSGTSSGWRPAWRWRGGTTGSPARIAARSSSRRRRATGRRCAASRSSPSWTSGTRTWTSSRPSASSRSQIKAKRFKEAEKLLAKAHTRDSMQALGKLTTLVDGRRRIISTRR